MPGSPAVRVGILVFIALIAFTAVAVFLTGYRMRMAGYPIVVVFDDAQGITQGSEVRMAGVTIGVVDKVTLDSNQRAIMRLLINQKYDIPVGSRFVLQIGLLIGDKYIDIMPKRGERVYYQACAKVRGEVPPNPEDLIPKAQKLLASLTRTSDNLNSVLGDKEIRNRLDRSLANLESSTVTLNKTMLVIQRTVVGEQDEVQVIIANVVATTESLRVFTDELVRFSKQGNIQRDISGTLEAARQSAESLERSTASLEKLATSPELQQDVVATIKEARATVEEAHKVIDHVADVVGVGKEGTPCKETLGPKINLREPSLDVMLSPADSNLRINGYLTIPQRSNHFIRLGVFDIANSNKGILQLGQSLNKTTDLRYGIYASKLGLGLDYAYSPRIFGSANLYNQNQVRLDVQGVYKVTDNWGVLMGIDELFWHNLFTVGAHFNR